MNLFNKVFSKFKKKTSPFDCMIFLFCYKDCPNLSKIEHKENPCPCDKFKLYPCDKFKFYGERE